MKTYGHVIVSYTLTKTSYIDDFREHAFGYAARLENIPSQDLLYISYLLIMKEVTLSTWAIPMTRRVL